MTDCSQYINDSNGSAPAGVSIMSIMAIAKTRGIVCASQPSGKPGRCAM